MPSKGYTCPDSLEPKTILRIIEKYMDQPKIYKS